LGTSNVSVQVRQQSFITDVCFVALFPSVVCAFTPELNQCDIEWYSVCINDLIMLRCAINVLSCFFQYRRSL
jgi:hypothetical protein